MSGIFGMLGINDTDRVYLSTIGQDVVYDAVTQTLAKYNADLEAAMSVFVEGTTTDHVRKYKLAGGGRLQRLGNRAPSAAVKATGEWSVGFPLEGFGASIAHERIEYAHMTVQDLQRHISTVQAQDTNTVRQEILSAVFNNSNATFVDPLWGSITVRRLANTDGSLFPPVLGSETEAQDNHYLSAGYASSAISDTNNPLLTIRDEIEEHFGAPTGGSNIAVFINPAQTAKISALTEFNRVNTNGITPGANTDTIMNLPNIPGRIIGKTDSGVWVSEWRFMPADYAFGIDLDQPGPLLQRIDEAYTGLPTGLSLIATDERYPMTNSSWEHRFGFGVGNRLNGVVMFISASGYAVPSGF